jgi:hypothetical protein
MSQNPATGRMRLLILNYNEMDLECMVAQDLANAVAAGAMNVFDVWQRILSIHHPGTRQKINYHFRRLLWDKLGARGIYNWTIYESSNFNMMEQIQRE